MFKKILFFFLIFGSSIIFSQEKSIDALSASPNTFSNATTISFESTNSQDVIISIKNVLGKVIFSKQIEAKEGKNSVLFDRKALQPGMYIYAAQTNNDFITKRFVIR